jgi:uncharacterized protein (TIRG00374 family)
MMNLWQRKGIRIAASIIITGLALWLSFRKIDWPAFRTAFSQVRWFWVVLGTANVIFMLFTLGWRWRILLRPKVNISLRKLFHLNIISQYTNIIAPARLGEAARAYLVSKNYGIPGGYVFGTVVIEKILDFFVFVALWVLVPTFFLLDNRVWNVGVALLLCFLTASLLVFIIWRPWIFLNFSRKVVWLFPGKFRKKLQDFAESGMESFQPFKDWKVSICLLGWTLVFVAGQALTNFFLFRAFGLRLSFWAALVVLLAVQAGNIPPSIPGKLGIFEYAVVLALSVFGVSKGIALSYGIMLHIVAFLPKIILGMVYMSSSNVTARYS